MVKTDISELKERDYYAELGDYVIYSIINLTNQKRYIGRTRNPKRRIAQHFIGIKKHKHPNPLVNNESNSDFGYEILETGIPKEQGKEKERFYIQEFKTYEDDYGYNGKDHCVSTIKNPKPKRVVKPRTVIVEEMVINVKKMRWLRENRGLTQTQLAELMGITNRATICAMEKEPWAVTLPTINRLARALECSPLSLIKIEEREVEEDAKSISHKTRQTE